MKMEDHKKKGVAQRAFCKLLKGQGMFDSDLGSLGVLSCISRPDRRAWRWGWGTPSVVMKNVRNVLISKELG